MRSAGGPCLPDLPFLHRFQKWIQLVPQRHVLPRLFQLSGVIWVQPAADLLTTAVTFIFAIKINRALNLVSILFRRFLIDASSDQLLHEKLMAFVNLFGNRLSSLYLSIGKSLVGGLLSLSRQGIFFLPLIYVLPRLFQLSGVIWVQPARSTDLMLPLFW